MVHAFLLLFGIVWGIVICVMLFSFSLKAGKGTWLVTIPGILIVAALATDFTGHMLQLPHSVILYQQQIVGAVRWIPLVAVPLLLLIRLCELWSKKRARPVSLAHPQPDTHLPSVSASRGIGRSIMTIFNEGPSECPTLTSEMVTRAEKSLGYKLPQSYVDALYEKNGGYLACGAFPTDRPTNWANNHVLCSVLMGVGCENGMDSESGSQYPIEEWEYPDVGVVFSSEGHTAFMLDYSACGAQGEPSVIYVDTDPELEVFSLAPTFAAFLSGLVEDIKEDGEDEEDDDDTAAILTKP